ncbi:hypothetical protein BZL39_B10090 [Zygosaccharomyces parabailii]|nr:hypothetical protein BZL39_B10090 [Zygosaccharomyces parabailii]
MANFKKIRMTRSDSASAGAQPNDDGCNSQTARSNLVNYWFRIPWSSNRWSVLVEEVLARVKYKEMSRTGIAGSIVILIHLASLLIYGGLGISSSDKDNYSNIFVYGGSIITVFSYVMLFCADPTRLTLSIFEQGEGESRGTHYAKVGVMGVILPAFNFIGLIYLIITVEQDRKTLTLGIIASISYFLGNALLFFSKRKTIESEEHELQENNLPVDTSPVDTSPVSNSPVDTSPVDTSPVDTSPVDTSPVDTSPVDTSPVDTSPVDDSPADNSPSIHNFP